MHKCAIMTAIAMTASVSLFANGANECSTGLATDQHTDLVVAFWGDLKKVKAIEDTADAYMNLHPNVDVILTHIPAWEYNDRIRAMISAGEQLDVMNINSSLFPDVKENLLELTTCLLDYGYHNETTGLYPGWFDILASDGHYDDGERLYQAPLNTATTVLAYNKRLFEEAHVPFPTSDWTWNTDFLDAAKKLSDSDNNKWAINEVDDIYVYPAVVAAYGGQLLDFETSPTQFRGNEDEAVNAIQFLHDLIYKHGAAPTPEQIEKIEASGIDLFREGHVAMYFLNTPEFPLLYDLEDDWDIALLPRGPATTGSHGESATTMFGERLAVLNSTINLGYAWNFIHLLNSKTGQVAFDTYFGFSEPPLQSVANLHAFTDPRIGAPENYDLRRSVLKDHQTVTINPTFPNADKVFAALEAELEQFWQKKDITAQAVMNQAARGIEPLLR